MPQYKEKDDDDWIDEWEWKTIHEKLKAKRPESADFRVRTNRKTRDEDRAADHPSTRSVFSPSDSDSPESATTPFAVGKSAEPAGEQLGTDGGGNVWPLETFRDENPRSER